MPFAKAPSGMLAAVLCVVPALLWLWCSRWRDALCGRGPVLDREAAAPLLLIAHPDDECMFFAPTILGLLQEQRPLSVLCCSPGNYYNQGEIRKKELIQSCAVLGIPSSNVTLIDHRDLPDDPRVQWDEDILSHLILRHIQDKQIDLVITFDKGGVSGHSNHISLYNTIRLFIQGKSEVIGKRALEELKTSLLTSRRLPEGCSVLLLQSVSIFRKYLSLLDLPVSWLWPHDALFVLSAEQHKQAKEAMACHQSQLLWFRHLYLLFSRYLCINSLSYLSCSKEPNTKVKSN